MVELQKIFSVVRSYIIQFNWEVYFSRKSHLLCPSCISGTFYLQLYNVEYSILHIVKLSFYQMHLLINSGSNLNLYFCRSIDCCNLLVIRISGFNFTKPFSNSFLIKSQKPIPQIVCQNGNCLRKLIFLNYQYLHELFDEGYIMDMNINGNYTYFKRNAIKTGNSCKQQFIQQQFVKIINDKHWNYIMK